VVTTLPLMLITPVAKQAAYTTPVDGDTDTPYGSSHCDEVASVVMTLPLMLIKPPPTQAAYTMPVDGDTDTPCA